MPLMLPGYPPKGFHPGALYRPRSLLLVADPAMPESAILARNIAAGGFHGSVQQLDRAAGIAELAVVPDLAVLCLAEPALGAAMAALAALGCHAAIVPGPARDLAGLSRRTGVRALGQGSFGLAVPGIGLNASLSHLAPAPGRLALVSQSAALTRAVLDWAAAENLGFSHIIGIGGNAVLGFASALDWLARDAGTGAVLLDLRQVRNRRAFISAARAAARTRPVVAIRAGGRGAARDGTADAVMEAALRRAGVLRVAGLEDLLAAAETLGRVALRSGASPAPGQAPVTRIGIATNGVGLGALAADALLAGGGTLAGLSGEATIALGLLLPEGGRPGNPLCVGPFAGPKLAAAAAMLAALPEVDAVVALHAPAPGDAAAEDAATAAMIAAGTANRGRAAPILVGWTGQATAGRQRRAMAEAGLAVFATPEAAVRGALHLAANRRNRAAAAELPPREVLEVAPDRAAAAAILAAARAAGRRRLTEAEALALLGAYGIPAVPGALAAGPEDAAAAAERLGFPVVLKLLCPAIAHKTDFGGVALGLTHAAAVLAEARAMLARVRAARPGVRITGLLVQRQAGRALELRLRLGEDAMFGPWIGFGLGGTAAELMADEAFDLPPLNLALAGQLIGRSRAARLLAGYRDHPPADRAAVAGALVRLSQIAVDFPEIAALTINPLFADGSGVLAVDAALTLRPPGARAMLAIAPYPAELAEVFETRSGAPLTIRPIRPEDAAALAEAFRRIDPVDVRRRFFSPLKEMPPGLVARLTQIDYDREMAFAAVRGQGAAGGGAEQILGVARLIRDPAEPEAEFAVIVAAGMKGQGLGRHLMERLFAWGRAVGVRAIHGHVLAENQPMLRFVRALGFAVTPAREEPEVMEVRRML